MKMNENPFESSASEAPDFQPVSEMKSPFPVVDVKTDFADQDLLSLYQNFEEQISQLERDIRQQKESSVNAKTAITFEQLRTIHELGKVLGPQKEMLFDRVCRAADIQRASLKNRLKQNKEKFEPVNSQPMFEPRGDLMNINLLSTLSPFGAMPAFSPGPDRLSPEVRSPDTTQRLPVTRCADLLYIGFRYDEVAELNRSYTSHKQQASEEDSSDVAFGNYLSTTTNDTLKSIGYAYNLLELGYTRKEVREALNYQKLRVKSEEDEVEAPSRKRKNNTGGLKLDQLFSNAKNTNDRLADFVNAAQQ